MSQTNLHMTHHNEPIDQIKSHKKSILIKFDFNFISCLRFQEIKMKKKSFKLLKRIRTK